MYLLPALLLLFSGNALARGPWRASAANTPGWQLMTPEEHIAHQARIRQFHTLAECEAYRREHHRELAARAQQQGQILNDEGRDFCAHLRPPAPGAH